ncbi:putative reverse transcriptase domain-containing protein, partial [Tanacetum coccineum]
MKKMYCLVVTCDFSRFSWVFFLATKDETSEILKTFITGIENLIDLNVKVIRCDNGTEFKNRVMNQFCEMKGIEREFSVARTPQQNRVAKRKNRTLIKAARTMLADSKLPTTFWAEAVNTACYVQNRVLVIKPQNKTPYEIFLGRIPVLSFMRPGYSTNSKAFRVFNSTTRIAEENLHVQFSENSPNITGSIPNWLFDIDVLTKFMNYKPVVAGNQSNSNADPPFSTSPKDSSDAGFKPSREEENKDAEDLGKDSEIPSTEEPRINQEKDAIYGCADDPNIPELEDIVYSDDDDEDVGAEADINNLDAFMHVSPIPTTRIHKDHPVEQIIGDLNLAPQTRRMINNKKEHGLFSSVQQRTNHKDFQNCLFACFLSQKELKKVVQALKDPSWIEAMQEELLQFKLQEVCTLVELPNEKRVIGTKWVLRNKKDERGIVIKNKARLVAQGLFLAYVSFKDFVVYQMDVKSAFLYGKIEVEVYVCQPPGFEDPDFPDRVYKVEKALYGLHQAPRAWYETLSTYLLDNGFQRGKIDKTLFIRRDKGLQVKQKEDGIFLSQDKYVTEILKKFGFSDVKTASTPMETHKPLLKDADGEDVDEHLYRYMIGSLMYLTSLRPDIILISWQCKKQTVVANSITEAEYIVASNFYGQVLWIQNQLLDYGYNFMHTKIYIDNESTICIVKNPVFYSKTKHIEIRHHFIRDSNEKKLIQMIKVYTYQNVADFLTKAFDRIIHKGWLKWNAKAAKDGTRVKTGNSKVNDVGHYLVL